MKVKDGDDFHDIWGRYPIRFSKVRNLREVHDWLWKHYQGHKFAIMFDESKDEYEDFGTEIYVYFLSDIAADAALEIGMKLVYDDRISTEWIEDENGGFYCSRCSFQSESKTKFCPNCGKKIWFPPTEEEIYDTLAKGLYG